MRHLLVFVAPWLPFFLLWVLQARIQGAPSLRAAVGMAALGIGSAALLSIPVRRLCGALPWPSHLGYGFVARHAVVALAFSLAWSSSPYAYESLVEGRPFVALATASRVFGWQVLMGLWLYGLVAGLTYAVALHRHAENQQRRAAEAEGQAAAARLEAIRARLHPHFLFNALHSLGALVRSDPRAAEAAVEALGQLLRQALSRDARPLVPMDEEWAFTRRYVEFEHMRYGERLRVAATVDDEALECLVPPFALQTLVENAVRHAIALTEGGRIAIRAHVESARLTLEVEDEGAPVEAAPSGQRYGLSALRERIASVYGQTAQLEAGALPAGGFLVRLVAPALKADKAEAGGAPVEQPA